MNNRTANVLLLFCLALWMTTACASHTPDSGGETIPSADDITTSTSLAPSTTTPRDSRRVADAVTPVATTGKPSSWAALDTESEGSDLLDDEEDDEDDETEDDGDEEDEVAADDTPDR